MQLRGNTGGGQATLSKLNFDVSVAKTEIPLQGAESSCAAFVLLSATMWILCSICAPEKGNTITF